jgi:Fe2+ or Zn2+ uptake regulation protein
MKVRPFHRSTRQRQAILEELRELQSHPTAVGLHEIVRRHDHVRCVRCGKVDDIHTPPLDLLEGRTDDSGGYKILDCPLFPAD